MRITEDALKRAWHRLAAGSDLLDEAVFPPTGTYEQYEAHVEGGGGAGLYLVLEEDGTVCGCGGPYDEVFVARGLDEALYCLAEEAVRGLDGTIAGQAALMDRTDPGWGRVFRGGGPDGAEPAPPCGRDPLEGFAWIMRLLARAGPLHPPRVLPRRERRRRADRPAVRGRPTARHRGDPPVGPERGQRRRPRHLAHRLGQLLLRTQRRLDVPDVPRHGSRHAGGRGGLRRAGGDGDRLAERLPRQGHLHVRLPARRLGASTTTASSS
ncbi:hypothetical protein R2F25_26195 [Streptomyces sp. UP1A-1]|nr:hypothetical protein [Streptomyces sp. UP1A-1]